MKIYVNEKGEIHDVGTTTDASLTEIELADEGNPFEGWTEDKICLYKVSVSDGRVQMMTPYYDSRSIEHFDRGGRAHGENSEGIFDIAELAGENSEAAYDLAEMLAELDERVTALEEKEA